MSETSANVSENHLPQPLARILPVLEAARGDARSLHAAAFASLEAVVRWQGLLLLTARSRLSLPVDREKRVQNFLKRPSFGSWVEVLLRHGAREQDSDPTQGAIGVLEDLRQVLETPREEYTAMVKAITGRGGNKPQRWVDALEHLPPYRNDFIGHAGFLTDEHYENKSPLFDGVVKAVIESMSQLDQHLKVHALENAGTSLDLQGSAAISSEQEVPEGIQPGECFLTRSSGELLVGMGELTHFDNGAVYLFDRTPRERRTEFIDFASGERSRRDGIALLESKFTENLSIDKVEGGKGKEVVTGRLSLTTHALRHTMTTQDRIWVRVVLENQSPIPATFSLQGEESKGWNWCEETFVADQEVGANESLACLIAAVPDHAGTVSPPGVSVSSSFDPKPQKLEPEGPIRVTDPDPLSLVGRADQVQEILNRLAQEDSPIAATLIGGAMGQRTGALISEVARKVREEGQRDLQGTFRGAAGQPLKGFQDLLRDLVSMQASDEDPEQMRETAAVLLEQWLGADAAAISYFLDELTGEGSLDKSAEQMRSFWWFKLFSAVSREAPLLLVLDDLEAADPDSLGLLKGLLERFSQEEIPVKAIAAIERDENIKTQPPEGWGDGISIQLVEVERIDLKAMEEMLSLAYVGAPFLDDLPWLAKELDERSAGNIGFAIDLVRSLGPTGQTVFEPSSEKKWGLKTPLPEREAFVENLPARRGDLYSGLLEKMPPEQVEIFESAALIEGEIPVEILERLHEDADALDDALDRFETDGFGEAVDTDLTIYRFKTETSRDAVLEHFGKSGRRAAMRRRRKLASALVDIYGAEGEQSRAIGKLYLDGGQPQEAIPCLLTAMQRRKNQGRNVEALEIHQMIQQAVEADGEIPKEAVAAYRLNLANVQLDLGDRDEAKKTLEESRFEKGSLEYVQSGIIHTNIHFRSGELKECQDWLDTIRESMEALGDAKMEQSFRTVRYALHIQFHEYQKALDESARVLELVQQSKDEFGIARCLVNRGAILSKIENFEEAKDSYTQAVNLFRDLGRHDLELIARVGSASTDYYRNKLEKAGEGFQKAIVGFRLLQNRHALSRNYFNLGRVYYLQGKFDLALDNIERSAEVRQEVGDQVGLVKSKLYLSEIQATLGNWSGADQSVTAALKVTKKLDQDILIKEGEIRALLNQLSKGEQIEADVVDRLEPEDNDSSDVKGLSFVLLCRFSQISERPLTGEQVENIQALIEELKTINLAHMKCLLTASLAQVLDDKEKSIALLHGVIEDDEMPPGAPVDMVISARANLEESGSSEREKWEAKAMAAVEERAKLIERPADRRRFLKARLGRLED